MQRARLATPALAIACATLILAANPAYAEDPPSEDTVGDAAPIAEIEPESEDVVAEEAVSEEVVEEAADEEIIEEDPGPDPSDVPYWADHETFEGALIAGLMYQDTHGQFSWFTREVGTPPQGLVLRAFDWKWYQGDGRLLEIDAQTPFETDQGGGLNYRQYGLGDFRAAWTTFEYNSFPLDTHSQWKASDYRLRYTGLDLINATVGRQHLAHGGIREFGEITGETIVLNAQVPFQTRDHRLQGRVGMSDTSYEDQSGRWRDIDTTRAGGMLQYEFGSGQYLSAAAAMSDASVAGNPASQVTRHYTVAYNDVALVGAKGLNWEVRGDWQGTTESIQRVWLPDDEWTLATKLTYSQSPWRLWAGYSTGERNRFRLSDQAIQELLLDPTRTSFERGIYIASSPQQTQFELGGRWRPDQQWQVSASWRRTRMTDLPPTSLGEGEPSEGALVDPVAPLWFSMQDRFEASARYTINPGRLLLLNGTMVERGLGERESNTEFNRWNLTYHDASKPFSWYSRLGWYSNSASREQIDLFANRAMLYGLGFSTPLLEDKLRLNGDATFGDGSGRGAYDELIGSLGLEYKWNDDLSLLMTYVGQAIDMQSTPNYDAESHRLGLYVKWGM